MGRKTVDRLRPLADGVLAGAGAGRSISTVRIGNSAGLRSSCRRSSWSFFALAQRVQGTSVLWCYDGGASMHRDLDVDAAIEGAAEKVRLSLKEGHLQTGPRPVIFTPGALDALLASLHSAVGAQAVYRKTSPLTGRIGERVLNPLVSITDDNRPEAGRAGSPFDEEGVPAFAFPIIEKGVLKNFLADLRFAARLDLTPGRGRRAGYASAPFPGAGNWAMQGGDTSLEHLLAEAEGGLLVDSLLGMHGSNLANGDFSANVGLGFAIGAGGEIQFRVKDAAIAGNFYALLGDGLLGLSSERRWGYSGTELLPWALCADVPVT
jgi:predicted Zn-dependent protease